MSIFVSWFWLSAIYVMVHLRLYIILIVILHYYVLYGCWIFWQNHTYLHLNEDSLSRTNHWNKALTLENKSQNFTMDINFSNCNYIHNVLVLLFCRFLNLHEYLLILPMCRSWECKNVSTKLYLQFHMVYNSTVSKTNVTV